MSLRILRFFCPARSVYRRNEKGRLSPGQNPADARSRLTSLKLRLEPTGGLHWSNCGGELDIASVSEVAEVLDGLAPNSDGVRHVTLDLRGLTFMDARATR